MTVDTRERLLDAAQQLVLERGFAATTVDAIIQGAGASKGSFFHHFPSKTSLGEALVERYSAADQDTLERLMEKAEAASDDPAEQIVMFLRSFEDAVGEITETQPGCLFVSFIYEEMPSTSTIGEHIRHSIDIWQRRILAKLDEAAALRPPRVAVDLQSLADHVFTVFEGGFILARATSDPERLRAQIRHLRTYVALLFGVE